MSVYCSPAVDFSYLFGIVKRDENGDIPIEELIVFYHQEFVAALKVFGFNQEVPTLLDLNVELLKHGAVNCAFFICFLPFTNFDWKETSVDEMMRNDIEGNKNFKKTFYNHPTCKKLLQKAMKDWAQKGWF